MVSCIYNVRPVFKAENRYWLFLVETVCETVSDVTGLKYSETPGRTPEHQSCKVIEKSDSLGEEKERACDSLVMCIVTTMNQGLRNGGGIGDILRAPSSGVS